MSENKKAASEQVKFLGKLVDLKELEDAGFVFIRAHDSKEEPETFVNHKYPTPRRTIK